MHFCFFSKHRNNITIMFMWLSLWHSQCESSPVSFGECTLSMHAATVNIPPCRLLLLLMLKADTHFTIPWRLQG